MSEQETVRQGEGRGVYHWQQKEAVASSFVITITLQTVIFFTS